MKLFSTQPLALFALSMLTACGAATQDAGSPTSLSGLAVDGYVAGATVYLDINGNAVLDVFEPRALTDKQGYFGIAADGTDYCNSSSSSDQSHCLSTGEYSGSLLRIEGGVDTLTGEPFRGVLTRSADATGSQFTTPLTSLLSQMSSTQVTAFLSAENTTAGTSLSQSDLLGNPLALNGNTSANQNHLIRTAWLVHKSAAIIAEELKRRYPSAVNQSLPTDFSPYVYQALVSAWDAAGAPDMQTFLGTAADITDLIDNTSYGASTLILADGGDNTGGVVATNIPTRVTDLLNLINNAAIFPEGSSSALSQSDVDARGRTIEILTFMLSQELPNFVAVDAANVDAAIADMVKPTTLTNLANSAADVKQIAADYLATGTAVTDYSARPNLASALTGAGVNATTPTTLNNGSGGTADLTIDSSSGTVNIDVVSVDVNGDGTPDSVSLPGTITPINDYTSVMTLDVMGSEQTVILETDASGNLVFDTSTMNLEGVDLGTFTL